MPLLSQRVRPMNAHTHDQAEGERRKGAALALVEARREVFVRRGRRALLRIENPMNFLPLNRRG